MIKKKIIGKKRLVLLAGLLFVFALLLFFSLSAGYLLVIGNAIPKVETLLVISDPPVLVSVDFSSKKEKAVNFVLLPNKLETKSAWGYGNYRLESIYKLGEQEKIGGGQLLAESLQVSFGIPVSGWIDLRATNISGSPGKLWLLSVFRKALFRKGSMNLPTKEAIFWLLSIIKTGGVEYKVHDIEKDGLTYEEIIENRSLLGINTEKINQKYPWLFFDRELESEGMAIAVLNGSDHAGLASAAKKVIELMSGHVVLLADYPESAAGCVLKTRKEISKSLTVLKLSRVFGCDIIHEDMRQNYRADVVIILGSEYSKRVGEPF